MEIIDDDIQIIAYPRKKIKIEIEIKDDEPRQNLVMPVAKWSKPAKKNTDPIQDLGLEDLDSYVLKDGQLISNIPKKAEVTYYVSMGKRIRSMNGPQSVAYIVKNEKGDIISQSVEIYYKGSKVGGVLKHLKKSIQFCKSQNANHVVILTDDDNILTVFDCFTFELKTNKLEAKKRKIAAMLREFISYKFKWSVKALIEDAYKLAEKSLKEYMDSQVQLVSDIHSSNF